MYLLSRRARLIRMWTSQKPAALIATVFLFVTGVRAEAVEIHDGDIGYIANNSIWFTDESDLAVWKRVRQAFGPKDVKIYQQIILDTRQAWQFIGGPTKVQIISYWPTSTKSTSRCSPRGGWPEPSGGSTIRII
jgi:hypothetical protein